jgi:hypothetical protein
MRHSIALQLTLLTTALLVCGATTGLADTAFEATITGGQAVPPNPSGAYGTVTVILNADETEAAYAINFAGLEAEQTAAHFHNAPPGEAGPVLFGLPLGSPLAGIWPVTPSDVIELFAGRVYLNIHSTLYPAGEIRGDLILTTVAETPTSWGEIKTLYR